jgi:uncharacterized membrane protein YbjE (DUF340 family)
MNKFADIISAFFVPKDFLDSQSSDLDPNWKFRRKVISVLVSAAILSMPAYTIANYVFSTIDIFLYKDIYKNNPELLLKYTTERYIAMIKSLESIIIVYLGLVFGAITNHMVTAYKEDKQKATVVNDVKKDS